MTEPANQRGQSPADERPEFARLIDAEVARLRAGQEASMRASPQAWHDVDTSLAGWDEPGPEVTADGRVDVRDLLRWHDEAFVDAAYRTLLRRPPDSAGFAHYLQSLRDGRRGKLEIIAELRSSAEGEAQRVEVHGLRARLALRRVLALPLVGRVAGIAHFLVRLPDLARNQERLEVALFQARSEARNRLNGSLAQVEARLGEAAQARLRSEGALRAALSSRIEAVAAELRMAEAQATDARREMTATARELLALADLLHDLRGASAARLCAIDARLLELHDEQAAARARLDAGGARLEDAHLRLEDTRLRLDDAHLRLDDADLRLDDTRLRLDDAGLRLDDADLRLGAARTQLAALDESKAGRAELAGAVASFRDSLHAKVDGAHLPGVVEAVIESRDAVPDDLYAAFEERFRGSTDEIQSRVAVYLPFLREAGVGSTEAPLLDLGCGRGEWLDVVRAADLHARGVDRNPVVVDACRERGLDVALGDLLETLRAQPDASLGAVSALHVIEHLPWARLIELLDEVRRVLRPGGIAIFETPNPENLLVGAATFHSDPTHRNPLPHGTMQFMLEARGFAPVRLLRLHPYPDGVGLPTVSAADLAHRLNSLFFGPQDYALIGTRP